MSDLARRSWPPEQLAPPYLDVSRDRADELSPARDFADLLGKRDPAPIEFHAGHVGWVVTGYELAKQVLGDRRFSVRADLARGDGAGQLFTPSGRGLFHLEDNPDHGRLRGAVTSELTPAKIQRWESVVEQLADECLDEMVRGNPAGVADFVGHFAMPFPALVMSRFLELPPAARELFLHATRRRAGQRPAGALALGARFVRESPAGARDLLLHAARRVANRRAPGSEREEALSTIASFLKHTMASLEADDGFLGRIRDKEAVDVDEAAGIVAQLLVAGSVVPASMLGLALRLVLSQDGGLSPFVSGGDAAERAVEEIFRYVSFESQPRIRVALEDVEVGGQLVAAGQLVAVVLETANRDPRAFDDPDSPDFGREPSNHLAFGWGAHQCPGQNLARLEVRVAMQRIAARMPDLRLADPGPLHVGDDSIVHTLESLPVVWGGAS